MADKHLKIVIGADTKELQEGLQDVSAGLSSIQSSFSPLFQSFQKLKIQTGSASVALKTLAGSVIGAGGVGIAFSAAIGALQALQQVMGGFGRKTKEANSDVENFISSLRLMEQVSNDAGASVHGQIAVVNALSSALLDTNKSYKERNNALEQFKKINKNYFGDLTLEAESLATLKDRVNDYTKALIQSAIVKGFQDEIGKVNKEFVEQNRILGDLEEKMNQAKKAKESFQASPNKNYSQELLIAMADRIEKKVKTTTEEYLTQKDVVDRLAKSQALLTGEVKKAVNAQLLIDPLDAGKEKRIKKETDALRDQISALEELGKLNRLLKTEEAKLVELKIKRLYRDDNGLDDGQKDRIANSWRADLEKKMAATFEVPISVTPKVKLNVSDAFGPLSEDFNKPILDGMQKSGEAAGKTWREGFSVGLKDIQSELSSIMTNTIVGVAESIGESLAGSGDVTAKILSVIADSLKQLGKALVALGVAQEAAKKALATLKPGVAIAAGVTAIAAGSYLKQKLAQPRRLADGGIFDRPTFLAGEAGAEIVAPLNKLKDFIGGESQNIFITGYIEDRVIKLAVANAERRQRRMF